MGMIVYDSPTVVKELLYEMDKDDYDKIVRNFGTEGSICGIFGKAERIIKSFSRNAR